jgi:hypothetical protein
LFEYSISGSTFTLKSNTIGQLLPAFPYTSNSGVRFNPAGTTIAYAYNNIPRLTFATRSSTTSDTWTTVSTSNTIPGTVSSMDWTTDGATIAIAHNVTPWVTMLNRSGDTFTKVTNPGTLPTGQGNGVDFNHNDTKLAVAHGSSPFITIYNKSGDTYTKVTNPATLPTQTAYGCAWNNDSSLLAVVYNISPGIIIYEVSGDTYTAATTGISLGTGGFDCAFSPDGNYLAISANSLSPYLFVYKITGSAGSRTFTKLTNPTVLPLNNITGIRWNNNSSWITTFGRNEIALFNVTDTLLTKYPLTFDSDNFMIGSTIVGMRGDIYDGN